MANNATFAGRCLECNGSVSMRVQSRRTTKEPRVWTGVCQNNHRLRLEISAPTEETKLESIPADEKGE